MGKLRRPFLDTSKEKIKVYAKQILANAKAIESVLKDRGFKICFGQTDNHLLLIDVTEKGVSGREAQDLLDQVGITCNKNMIPDDPRKPMDPSGIRIGTPAMTTRGFKEEDFTKVGDLIARTIEERDNPETLEQIKAEILELTNKYPLYPELN